MPRKRCRKPAAKIEFVEKELFLGQTSVLGFPSEIEQIILRQLDAENLFKCRLVSKSWSHVCTYFLNAQCVTYCLTGRKLQSVSDIFGDKSPYSSALRFKKVEIDLSECFRLESLQIAFGKAYGSYIKSFTFTRYEESEMFYNDDYDLQRRAYRVFSSLMKSAPNLETVQISCGPLANALSRNSWLRSSRLKKLTLWDMADVHEEGYHSKFLRYFSPTKFPVLETLKIELELLEAINIFPSISNYTLEITLNLSGHSYAPEDMVNKFVAACSQIKFAKLRKFGLYISELTNLGTKTLTDFIGVWLANHTETLVKLTLPSNLITSYCTQFTFPNLTTIKMWRFEGNGDIVNLPSIYANQVPSARKLTVATGYCSRGKIFKPPPIFENISQIVVQHFTPLLANSLPRLFPNVSQLVIPIHCISLLNSFKHLKGVKMISSNGDENLLEAFSALQTSTNLEKVEIVGMQATKCLEFLKTISLEKIQKLELIHFVDVDGSPAERSEALSCTSTIESEQCKIQMMFKP